MTHKKTLTIAAPWILKASVMLGKGHRKPVLSGNQGKIRAREINSLALFLCSNSNCQTQIILFRLSGQAPFDLGGRLEGEDFAGGLGDIFPVQRVAEDSGGPGLHREDPNPGQRTLAIFQDVGQDQGSDMVNDPAGRGLGDTGLFCHCCCHFDVCHNYSPPATRTDYWGHQRPMIIWPFPQPKLQRMPRRHRPKVGLIGKYRWSDLYPHPRPNFGDSWHIPKGHTRGVQFQLCRQVHSGHCSNRRLGPHPTKDTIRHT